ncbi:multidrug effflux MFS transporter [Uliginosibacterium sp. H1]|uniref:multidrug effflux MFS transporter n=1 Tax=Uliginosibacterium sp. H1 TaxID=3114757 RepID=UPI002E184ED6|nr:multidrug effflux MFS transporter [Uliginosibacterium sp. H1]
MPTSHLAKPISYPLLAMMLALLNAIGPFAIDTYLPAFPAIEAGLRTTPLAMQQSLTAYMLPFAFMMLWHGALADALGRRRVLLVGLTLFALASVVCVVAQSIEMLWLGRALQGLSAGVGVVVGRAIIRDVLEGPAAQRLMAHVAMVFALAPAVAPIFGGWITEVLGWRSVFGFLALLGVIQLAMTIFYLPETLPVDQRQSLHPVDLLRGYGSVLGHPGFVLSALSLGLMFTGFFVYVMSAPVFLMQHLQLSSTDFGWLFIPLVCGMVCGSALSARLAGKLSRHGTVRLGFCIMAVATLINLVLNYFVYTSVVSRIPQLALYTFGMSLAMPSLSLIALDMFPERRGLAASCQGFIQMLVTAACAGLLAPAVWSDLHHLAWAATAGWVASLLCFVLYVGHRNRPQTP